MIGAAIAAAMVLIFMCLILLSLIAHTLWRIEDAIKKALWANNSGEPLSTVGIDGRRYMRSMSGMREV